MRIEKPVSIPDDDDIADPDNSAFGPTGVMREIVGYAPVEPDGSVRMKVPANIAFQISMLDANGRRVSPVHRSWLQVRPGEVLECNGCHVRTGTTPMVHGRKGLFNSVYAGATATGGAFPGTVNTISPEAGDTMARARSRNGSSCIDPTTHGRTLRTAGDHAERQRGVRRDLEAGRGADRLVLLQLSAADDRRCRPTRAASRSGRRPAASPFTTPPSARARATFIRCGRCRVPPAGVDRRHGQSSPTRRPAPTATTASVRWTPARCNCRPHRSSSTDEVSNEDALQTERLSPAAVRSRPSWNWSMGAVVSRADSGPPDANGIPHHHHR